MAECSSRPAAVLAEVRRVRLDEERDVLRDLSRQRSGAGVCTNRLFVLGSSSGLSNRVGLKLAEDSELEVHIVVGFDDDLRPGRQRSDQEDGNHAGGGTMCVHAHVVPEGNARATSPPGMPRTDLQVFRVIWNGGLSLSPRRAAHRHSKPCLGAQPQPRTTPTTRKSSWLLDCTTADVTPIAFYAGPAWSWRSRCGGVAPPDCVMCSCKAFSTHHERQAAGIST